MNILQKSLAGLLPNTRYAFLALMLMFGVFAFAGQVAWASAHDTPPSVDPAVVCSRDNIPNAAERGACLADPAAYVTEDDGEGVLGLVATVINFFSLVVGIISVIMIIIGGLKYITSAGDSGKVDSAKNTILYAIIGLVVVAFAQVIVLFVLTEVGTN